MLNTMKYLKGLVKVCFNFSEKFWAMNATQTLDNKFILETQVSDFILKNKDAIKQWIQDNSARWWQPDYIAVSDLMNVGTSSYGNLVTISKKLDVKFDLARGYNISELLTKLNSYQWEKVWVVHDSKVQSVALGTEIWKPDNSTVTKQSKSAKSLELQWWSIINTFSESDTRNKAKVKELQKALNARWHNLKVDGIYGNNTYKALLQERTLKNSSSSEPMFWAHLFKDSRNDKVVSEQFNWNASEIPLYGKETNLDQANQQIERTSQAMINLRDKLLITQELNKRLSKASYREDLGYSIENAVRTVLWDNKYRKILDNKEHYDKVMSQPQAKAKIERAVMYLTQWTQRWGDNEPNEIFWNSKEILAHVKKALPWLFGIYLWDLPLPFVKKMMPGVDVNKSVAFTKWIEAGANWEFETYYKQSASNELRPIQEQIRLIDVLSRLNLTGEQQAQVLSWNLKGLDKNTYNLLLTYIEFNLIPNLEILSRASFNAFERWEWYTLWGLFGLARDGKHGELNHIISWLKKAVSNWNLVNSEAVSKAFQLLSAEWDVSKKILWNVEAWQKYMENIDKNNQDIQSLRELAENSHATLNDYNRLFALTDLRDLENLWIANESDKASLRKLISILSVKPLNTEELKKWERNNPRTYKFVKSLWSSKWMQEYLINSIPAKNNLKFVNVWNSKHWVDLSKNDLSVAEKTTPEKWSKLSTLWFAYKSFIEKGNLAGIGYEDFRNAFYNWSLVSIDSVLNQDAKIVNTWRKSWQWEYTSFAWLKQKWDKEVFKLAPIQKTYSFYEWNQIVTVNVNYDLYLRTDCTNPLLVPWTIKTYKSDRPITEWELVSLTQVNGKLPIIIPWALFKKPNKPNTPDNPPTPPEPTPPPTVPPVTPPPPTVPPVTPPNPGISSQPIVNLVWEKPWVWLAQQISDNKKIDIIDLWSPE